MGGKEQWDPQGSTQGCWGEQREPWGWAGGEGMLRTLLAPWQGLEEAGKALFNLHMKYSLKFGILKPSGSFGKGSHGKETLCEGLTQGSAEPGGKIRERQRERGKKPKVFPTCSSPKSQGSRGTCSQSHLTPQHFGPPSQARSEPPGAIPRVWNAEPTTRHHSRRARTRSWGLWEVGEERGAPPELPAGAG